jgi:hypothetical protein
MSAALACRALRIASATVRALVLGIALLDAASMSVSIPPG